MNTADGFEPPVAFRDEAVRQLGARRRAERWWRQTAAVESLTLRDVLSGCVDQGLPVAVSVTDLGVRHGVLEVVGSDVVVLRRPAWCELIALYALGDVAVDAPTPDRVFTPPGADVDVGPTLLGELEDRLPPGGGLTLWLRGGHRVDGVLVAVGDDLVTVRRGGRLHHVAAASLVLVSRACAGS